MSSSRPRDHHDDDDDDDVGAKGHFGNYRKSDSDVVRH